MIVIISYNNHTNLTNGNNSSIEDTFNVKTNQIGETSLSENYDDFRVNTSQTGMNRWFETSSSLDLNVNKSIENERSFNLNYNQYYSDNFTSFDNLTDSFDSIPQSSINWVQDGSNNTFPTNPVGIGSGKVIMNSESRNYFANYTIRQDQPFILELDFIGAYLRRNANSIIRDYSCAFQIRGSNKIIQIRDYHYSDTSFALQLVVDSEIINLKTFTTPYPDTQARDIVFDVNLYYDYYSIIVNGSVFNYPPSTLNFSYEYELDSVIGDFYLRNYVNFFDDSFTLSMRAKVDSYSLKTYNVVNLLDSDNYLIFYRNVNAIGSFSSLLEFNSWSSENTSSYFFFGLTDQSFNYALGYLIINNSIYFYNGLNDNITPIIKNQKLNFQFNVFKDYIEYTLESNISIFKNDFNYDIDVTNRYYLTFIILRDLQYDELDVTLDYVSAPFKEALAVREQIDGSGDNINTETQFKINFEGNQSDSGYDERISYSYNIQDFSSISGLLRAESNRHYNFMYIRIEITPIDSDGLINLTADFPTASNDYMIAINYIHWWVSSTSGYMLCSFTDYDNNDLAETQVNNAVSSEIGFYVWQKNTTNTQVGLKYIEPIENDFTEGFDIALLSECFIFEKTNWMNVKIVYNYNNDDDSDTEASIGFNSIKHERGFSLEAPTILTPSTPTLYEKPTGFFASLIGFLVAPFVWLLGAMLWVVKAIFSLPELIIKGIFDLIVFIVNIVLPIIWNIYHEVVEWLFETVPLLEDIWEFLVDILNFGVDTIIAIFPILPLIFEFIQTLITWIIDNVYPYAEYWMNKLINDTNTALVEIFLLMNVVALIPFFLAIVLKAEELNQETIDLEDLFIDNLGYYISFWSFIYRTIISLLSFVFRLIEMIIGFIGGIIP